MLGKPLFFGHIACCAGNTLLFQLPSNPSPSPNVYFSSTDMQVHVFGFPFTSLELFSICALRLLAMRMTCTPHLPVSLDAFMDAGSTY